MKAALRHPIVVMTMTGTEAAINDTTTEAEVDDGVEITVMGRVDHRIPTTSDVDPSRDEEDDVLALLAHCRRHRLLHHLHARVLESRRKGGGTSGDIIINTALKIIVQHLHQGHPLPTNDMIEQRRRKRERRGMRRIEEK